jgi:pimeloyl-ACP methyl ester carboxylesterase
MKTIAGMLSSAVPESYSIWAPMACRKIARHRMVLSEKQPARNAVGAITPHAAPARLRAPKLIDDLIGLARKHRAGAAVLQLQRLEVTWNRLRTNYVNRLPEIAIPTLILHGEDDRLLLVPIAERAHHLIPNSRLEIIPDCGHLAPLEQPEAVNRALCEFLHPIP